MFPIILVMCISSSTCRNPLNYKSALCFSEGKKNVAVEEEAKIQTKAILQGEGRMA